MKNEISDLKKKIEENEKAHRAKAQATENAAPGNSEHAKEEREAHVIKFDTKINSLKAELSHYAEWTNHTPYGELIWTKEDLQNLLEFIKSDFDLYKDRKL